MRPIRKRRPGILGTPVAMLIAMLALTIGSGVAFRSAAARADDGAERHPAHIHAGTCEQLGDVVAPLGDVDVGMTDGGTPSAGEAVGPESATPVETSVTTVDMPLAEIAEGGHAINVHESAQNIDEYIACGDIGGRMMGETLVIGLREPNDSGHAGVAVLEGEGDATTVTVYLLAETTREGGAATPAATEEAAAAEGVAVEIEGFAYNPDPVEVPVGGTVTWTNRDAVPHTATGRDRGVLQSGTLNQGESYSQTFDEPGTFDYFCEFHANMKGTVVVR